MLEVESLCPGEALIATVAVDMGHAMAVGGKRHSPAYNGNAFLG